MISAVDLFCGAGGLTKGLTEAGIDVQAGVDLDEDCRYAYESNFGARFHSMDVSALKTKQVREWLGSGRTLVAGCAPCQPFSLLTNGRAQDQSPQYPLLAEFGRIVAGAKPDYVTMENVAGLARTAVFQEFHEELVDLGYKVAWSIEDCNAFGVPQRRRRLVLLAALQGQAPRLRRRPGPRPSAGRFLLQTPKLEAGGRHHVDSLHRATGLSAKNIKRMKASVPGGTWREWPARLRLDCHKKASGASFEQAYGRIDPSVPAPTITTKFFNYGSGRFGHPRDDRALTPREAALLQTFAPDYRFEDPEKPLGFTELGRLIGNAVPVALGRAVGEAIVRHSRIVG